MLIEWNPEDWEVVSDSYTCSYHREHPGESYAGCACWSRYMQRRKRRSTITVPGVDNVV